MTKRYAPRGLKTQGRKLWDELTNGDFEFNAAEYRILEDACREVDLIDRLEEELAQEPTTVKGSMGQKVAHPHVSEIRQHRLALRNLIAALKLPEDVEDGAVSPSSAGANLVMHRYRGKSG